METLFKFYFDHAIGMTHAEKHGVHIEELQEFFDDIKIKTYKRRDESLVSIGKLASGRYLKVAYRKLAPKYMNVITAYDIEDKELIDYLERWLEDNA